jgi:hydroxyacylglutathione hydrolase
MNSDATALMDEIAEDDGRALPELTAVPAFDDNYLWLVHGLADPTRVAAVDPGDAAAIESALASRGLSLEAILVTHHHRDHVGGVEALLDRHPGIPVFGPAGEEIPGRSVALTGGEKVSLTALGLEFVVLAVPGHTRGHIAYYGHGTLFCGDTLFSGGCGRLFEGTAAQMLHSLDRLASLPGDTRVCCAHEYTASNLAFAAAVEPANEPLLRRREDVAALRAAGRPTLPSTLKAERTFNPFLRVREPTVRHAAETRAGAPLADPVAVFAAIRTWKDGFRG